MNRRSCAALLAALAACRGVPAPPGSGGLLPASRLGPASIVLVDADDPAFRNPREVGAPIPCAWSGSPAREIDSRLVRLRRCVGAHRANIANAGTIGYKALDLHRSNVSYRRCWRQGPLEVTERQLDLAIEGAGFFRVTLPDGALAFTRGGNFQIDAEGNLTTAEGLLVEPNQTFPENMVGVTISRTGQIFVIDLANPETPQQVGQFELSRFVNPSGLRPLQEGLYVATAGSGNAIDGQPADSAQGFGTVRQGYLEGSNVDLARDTSALEEDGEAISLLGRLSESVKGADPLQGGPAIELEPGCVRIDTRLAEVDESVERWLRDGGIAVRREGAWFVIDRSDPKKLEELLRECAGRLRRRALVRMDNLSNAETTSTGFAGRPVPYRRRIPLPGADPAWVEDTSTGFRKIYEPNHPHAIRDANAPDFGTVAYPNVDPLVETVDMISDLRSFELVTAVLTRVWLQK